MIPIVESFSIDIKQEWPGCEDVSIVFNREVVINFLRHMLVPSLSLR